MLHKHTLSLKKTYNQSNIQRKQPTCMLAFDTLSHKVFLDFFQ